MEQRASEINLEQTEPEDKKISVELDAYLQDPWLKGWFASEPSLQNENLQPYYYFSRDRLTITGLSLQRMSPKAQEYYRKLLSEAESISTNALAEAKTLNEGDASAIFETLSQKTREAGKQNTEKSLLKKLMLFCKQRTELMSQLLGFLEKFPETDIPPVAVSWLQDVVQESPYKLTAKGLVQRWELTKKNINLARISKSKLKDFE